VSVLSIVYTRGVGRICERGVRVPTASVGARAYNGGLGAEPPAGVQGAEPLVWGQGGEAKSGQIGSILCVWEKTAKKAFS